MATESGSMRRSAKTWLGPLLVLAIIATIGVAPSAAGADPVPSNVTVSVLPAPGPGLELRVQVASELVVPSSGTVVLSVDGVEVGRAVVARAGSTGSARFRLEPDPGTTVAVTADYLGSEEVQAGSVTRTVTFPEVAPDGLATSGSLTVGQATFPISTPVVNGDTPYDPRTGAILLSSQGPMLTASVPTPGGGTASISLRVEFERLTGQGVDGTVANAQVYRFGFDVERVVVDGVAWDPGCRTGTFLPTTELELGTGTLEVHLDGTWSRVFSQAECAGFADLLNSVLSGPYSMDISVESETFEPAPPQSTVATTTTVEVLDQPLVEADRLTVEASVQAPGGLIPWGSLQFTVNGAPQSVMTLSEGATKLLLPDVLEPGTITVTADFIGNETPLYDFEASSGSTTVQVAPRPPGRPATGSLEIGVDIATPLPDGLRLAGAAFDPSTGAIGPGSFWGPTYNDTISYAGFDIGTVSRLTQVGEATGQVEADGSASFGPVTLKYDTYSANVFGTVVLENCTTTFSTMLTGSADADGLHLEAFDVVVPPVPSDACAGFASTVNARLGPADLVFDVEGDFSRGPAPGSVGVFALYPSVALFNQNLFVASVEPGSTGSVVFEDGDHELGVAPVDDDGRAVLIADLPLAGARSVTATYGGDVSHAAGEGVVAVEVTPAPVGLGLGGSGDVGGVGFDLSDGSVLVPQSGALPADGAELSAVLRSSRASLWFTPTVVDLDLPGYGEVQAEVRLIQNGELSEARVGPGGEVTGLSGAFGLHLREVTTASGTVTPVGCVNVVLLSLDGQLRFSDAMLGSVAGGSARYRIGSCTGVGQAVIEELAGTSVGLDLDIAY